MEIDAACLRWAQTPNMERLARALRVPLPVHKHGEAYRRALIRALARALTPPARDIVAETEALAERVERL